MKNNLFDSYIKEHLGDSRPDVPSHVWENIMAKKDRKKPVGFFTNSFLEIAFAVLFILGISGGIIYLSSQKNISNNIKEVNAELNTTEDKTADKNIIVANKILLKWLFKVSAENMLKILNLFTLFCS